MGISQLDIIRALLKRVKAQEFQTKIVRCPKGCCLETWTVCPTCSAAEHGYLAPTEHESHCSVGNLIKETEKLLQETTNDVEL